MLRGLLIALVCYGIIHLLARNSNREPIRLADGTIEFRAGKLPLILGLIPAIIGIGALIGCIYVLTQDIGNTVPLVLFSFFILFFGLGMPNVLSGLYYKIVISDSLIQQRTLFNQWKSLPWNEVAEISYLKTNRDLLLKGKGIKIRCNEFLVGFPELAQNIAERVHKDTSGLVLLEHWTQKHQ